ncbi:MAG: CDP-diacylglycerol--serine O-phosphatidyltransferase [Bacteroidales bacterium]|nr:CDP-diacylglycerol--serine O-phosphatidyltransferase [Bacteroidales bacterium]
MRKYIPNILTLLNLTCGCCAVIMALWGLYLGAFLFIIGSAVFDFLDGFSARLLKVYSDIGKELDSLADLVSFGLAPSLIFFNWYYQSGHHYTFLAFVPLVITAFSALRLAKFNLDTRQETDFIGLSTPANAMIIAPLVAYADICHIHGTSSFVNILLDSVWFIPTISIVLALLLLSEIPMFSLKKKRVSFNQAPLFSLFIVLALAIIILGLLFIPYHVSKLETLPLIISAIFTFYVIINILAQIVRIVQKER